jgi:hypothetical protein
VAGDGQINTQMSNGGSDDSNDGTSGTLQVIDEPPKKGRGRGKRNLMQLRVPPHNGKVMLKPVGSRCVYVTSVLCLSLMIYAIDFLMLLFQLLWFVASTRKYFVIFCC